LGSHEIYSEVEFLGWGLRINSYKRKQEQYLWQRENLNCITLAPVFAAKIIENFRGIPNGGEEDRP
jgi:hypothetical protein